MDERANSIFKKICEEYWIVFDLRQTIRYFCKLEKQIILVVIKMSPWYHKQ